MSVYGNLLRLNTKCVSHIKNIFFWLRVLREINSETPHVASFITQRILTCRYFAIANTKNIDNLRKIIIDFINNRIDESTCMQLSEIELQELCLYKYGPPLTDYSALLRHTSVNLSKSSSIKLTESITKNRPDLYTPTLTTFDCYLTAIYISFYKTKNVIKCMSHKFWTIKNEKC